MLMYYHSDSVGFWLAGRRLYREDLDCVQRSFFDLLLVSVFGGDARTEMGFCPDKYSCLAMLAPLWCFPHHHPPSPPLKHDSHFAK